MSILVVCPGCRKRFQVSDQFAGKSGPCPHCKTAIRIPTKEEEVVVHGPEEAAATAGGPPKHLVTKPIARKEIRLRMGAAGAIVASGLLAFLAAYLAGEAIRESLIVRVIGLIAVSPPLVVAGYSILHDEELEPYRGRPLYLRSGVLAMSYAALWGIFSYVAGMGVTGDLWTWLLVVPPFLVAGALTALACLDLDFGSGFFLYGFYLLLTMALGWAAGLGWPWDAAIALPV